MISQVGSVVTQVAPFLSIILLEILHPGFNDRLSGVFDRYSESELFGTEETKECENMAIFSHEYEAVIKHLELTLFAVVVVFIGEFINASTDRLRIILGVVLFVSVLFIAGTRYAVMKYFEKQSPDRYRVTGNIAGVSYGILVVIAVNLVIITLIIGLSFI